MSFRFGKILDHFELFMSQYLIIRSEAKSVVQRVSQVCSRIGGDIPGILTLTEIHVAKLRNDFTTCEPTAQSLFKIPV